MEDLGVDGNIIIKDWYGVLSGVQRNFKAVLQTTVVPAGCFIGTVDLDHSNSKEIKLTMVTKVIVAIVWSELIVVGQQYRCSCCNNASKQLPYFPVL